MEGRIARRREIRRVTGGDGNEGTRGEGMVGVWVWVQLRGWFGWFVEGVFIGT